MPVTFVIQVLILYSGVYSTRPACQECVALSSRMTKQDELPVAGVSVDPYQLF